MEFKLSGYPKANAQLDDTIIISRLSLFLTSDCGINNPIYKKENDFYLRDLRGPQKIKLFSKFDLKNLFPEYEDSHKVDDLWRKFYYIYNSIKDNKLVHYEIETLTKEWLNDFLKLYHRKHVTPYMHAFTFHLKEFVEIYGDINAFNQQGHEKLNDITTLQYFKSTNIKCKARSNFLMQLIEKRNRSEIFKLKTNI